jgi:hypothetical protein
MKNKTSCPIAAGYLTHKHTHKKNQQKKTKIQHNAKIKTEIKPKGKMSLAEGCHPLWESERAAWLREF